jgi:hypothetical protein
VPFAAFLDGHKFDSETKRIMGVAFEMTCAALHLSYRGDSAAQIVADKIISLAKQGELDPDRLCERALNELRNSPPIV